MMASHINYKGKNPLKGPDFRHIRTESAVGGSLRRVYKQNPRPVTSRFDDEVIRVPFPCWFSYAFLRGGLTTLSLC